jgi:hypothetical protein
MYIRIGRVVEPKLLTLMHYYATSRLFQGSTKAPGARVWRVNELKHFITRLCEGSIRALNVLVLYSYCTFLGVCVRVCVCVPAYWPSRVCGAEWGAEERWSMGAWRVAAEGSWWSSATRTAACRCTDACRCCAGTYSNATGATSATVCVTCGAGESRMLQARHVMPAYPIIS